MSSERTLADTADVSEYLRVPISTLHDWRHRGVGPRAIRVGRHLRYRWSDIETWLEAQSRASEAS